MLKELKGQCDPRDGRNEKIGMRSESNRPQIANDKELRFYSVNITEPLDYFKQGESMI